MNTRKKYTVAREGNHTRCDYRKEIKPRAAKTVNVKTQQEYLKIKLQATKRAESSRKGPWASLVSLMYMQLKSLVGRKE